MTVWQPGMIVTADRLNDFTPVPLTISPTAASGFSLSAFSARKTAGTTEWSMFLTRTGGTLTADAAGNLADTLCATLPVECRPDDESYTIFESAGSRDGAVRILTNGQCYLTTMSPTSSIATGATVKFSGSFATG